MDHELDLDRAGDVSHFHLLNKDIRDISNVWRH